MSVASMRTATPSLLFLHLINKAQAGSSIVITIMPSSNDGSVAPQAPAQRRENQNRPPVNDAMRALASLVAFAQAAAANGPGSTSSKPGGGGGTVGGAGAGSSSTSVPAKDSSALPPSNEAVASLIQFIQALAALSKARSRITEERRSQPRRPDAPQGRQHPTPRPSAAAYTPSLHPTTRSGRTVQPPSRSAQEQAELDLLELQDSVLYFPSSDEEDEDFTCPGSSSARPGRRKRRRLDTDGRSGEAAGAREGGYGSIEDGGSGEEEGSRTREDDEDGSLRILKAATALQALMASNSDATANRDTTLQVITNRTFGNLEGSPRAERSDSEQRASPDTGSAGPSPTNKRKVGRPKNQNLTSSAKKARNAAHAKLSRQRKRAMAQDYERKIEGLEAKVEELQKSLKREKEEREIERASWNSERESCICRGLAFDGSSALPLSQTTGAGFDASQSDSLAVANVDTLLERTAGIASLPRPAEELDLLKLLEWAWTSNSTG